MSRGVTRKSSKCYNRCVKEAASNWHFWHWKGPTMIIGPFLLDVSSEALPRDRLPGEGGEEVERRF